MSAETGAGAWLWASGSQVWRGANPTLVPKPRISRPAARRITPGSRWRAAAVRAVQSRVAAADVPVWRDAKYTRTVARNASATPTEATITYFHDASSDAVVRRWPTRNAVAMVVASTETHITPRLLATTAMSIAAMNSCTKMAYRRAPPGVV